MVLNGKEPWTTASHQIVRPVAMNTDWGLSRRLRSFPFELFDPASLVIEDGVHFASKQSTK